jgi:hypothetical protein
MAGPEGEMENSVGVVGAEHSPIATLLKELWAASESERNSGVSK